MTTRTKRCRICGELLPTPRPNTMRFHEPCAKERIRKRDRDRWPQRKRVRAILKAQKEAARNATRSDV